MSNARQDFLRLINGDNKVLEQYGENSSGSDQPTALRTTRMEGDESSPLDDQLPTVKQLESLQKQVIDHPEDVLGDAYTDPTEDSITQEQLLEAIKILKGAIESPEEQMEAFAADAQNAGLWFFDDPIDPRFDFPGYSPDSIPIDFKSTQFQTGDIRYAISYARRLFGRKYKPYPKHQNSPVGFVYRHQESIPDGGHRVGFFADFGNGLYAPQYIAKQLIDAKYPHVFHLGDVYYGGTEGQFRDYYEKLLSPMLENTQLFSMLENHEMDSGGKYYFDFLNQNRSSNSIQQQEGSYFSCVIGKHQIIGLDVNYFDPQRLKKEEQIDWFENRLEESRARRLTTILLTGGGPYTLKKSDWTKLYEKDLKPLLAKYPVDLWLWGHHHYCALFDRSASTPFLGSCIGHGGYPYSIKEMPSSHIPEVLWLEDQPRFPPWTGHRQDRGNNGFLEATLLPGGEVDLTYIDWMSNIRCEVNLRFLNQQKYLTVAQSPPQIPLPGPPTQ